MRFQFASASFDSGVVCCLASLLVVFVTTAPLSATLTVNVISPQPGITSGSPVFFEAEAQSDCKAGISALRIYSAPGVAVFTTLSPHLETFVDLSAGSNNTVVQAWDNCGAVTKVPVTLTVTTESKVTVFLPDASTQYGPTHFAASAQSPGCSAGIAAMRVYTSWGVGPYTVLHNQLDAYIQLSPGVPYDATMQAWDNCGNVLKTNFQITGSSDSDSYVYVADDNGLEEFNVLSTGRLAVDSPPFVVPINSPAGELVRHPGGWFLYARAGTALYGFAINSQNGSLTPIPGSPWNFSSAVASLAIDPAGNFLYVTQPQPVTGNNPPTTLLESYAIDRSSGAIAPASTVTVPELVFAITTDPYGQFIYASGSLDNSQPAPIYAYAVQPNTGTFTATYGSPFSFPDGTYLYALSSAYQYLYAANLESNGNGDIASYQINYNSGSLYAPLGPYRAPDVLSLEHSMQTDWLARYVWAINNSNSGNSYLLYDIDGYTGALSGPSQNSTGTVPIGSINEGNAANEVYAVGGSCGPVTCVPGVVSGWSINVSAGGILNLLNSFQTQGNNPTSVVAVRAHPQ